MTLPDERYRSIKWAERFLEQVANSTGYKRIPQHVRNEARSILRHFPSDWDLDRLSRASPDVLQREMEPVTRLFLQYEQSRAVNCEPQLPDAPSNPD